MLNDTYFEVLVYSCDQDAFVAKVTTDVDNYMAIVPDYGNGFWQQERDEGIKRELKPIRYNELVGCLDIYAFGSQLRADYWFTDKKRVIAGARVKGTIRPCGKLIEKRYSHSNLSSPEIFADFRAALNAQVRRHSRLRNRYVDFGAFDRCGPLVDWRAVLKLRNAG
jgi:hypothetical protein